MSTLILSIAALALLDVAWHHRASWSRRRLALWVGGALLCSVLAAATIPNFLYLGKVLGRLAMPVGLLWLGLCGAVAYFLHRRAWRSAAGLGVVLALYTVAGSPAVGGALLYSLEADFREINPLEGPPLDAVFVMGGGTGIDPRGNPSLTAAGDRVLVGARVYEAGRTPIVVTSGSTIPGIGEARDLAEEGASILRVMGVPDEAIVRLPAPKNSSQELAAYKALADDRGWNRVGLVSSAWHLRRGTRLAEANDLPVSPLPADFRGRLSWDGLLAVIPDGAGFRDVTSASWEYLGAAVGR